MSIFRVLNPTKKSHPTTSPKIQKFIYENITGQLNQWMQMLLDGNLHRYENELSGIMNALFNFISGQLLPEAAVQLVGKPPSNYRSSCVSGIALGARCRAQSSVCNVQERVV